MVAKTSPHMSDSWENGVTELSSTAERRKEQGGWKCCSIAGETESWAQVSPKCWGGSGKSNICQVLVPGFTHVTLAARELSAASLGCSPHPAPGWWLRQSQPYLQPGFEYTRRKIQSFPEPEAQVLYSAKSLKHGKSYFRNSFAKQNYISPPRVHKHFWGKAQKIICRCKNTNIT